MRSPTEPPRIPRLALLLVAGGAVGLLAAAMLLIEKIALIQDPDYIPACNINPILSCGSVMSTSAAEAFGFPNPILGVAAFPVVITTGVILLAGVVLPRAYWRGLQVGVTLGVVFVHWLMFQSLYRIDALCPYCMAVWAVVIPTFIYVTLNNFSTGALPAPRRLRSFVAVIDDYRGVVLTGWYLAILAAITQRFWDYWQTLLP